VQNLGKEGGVARVPEASGGFSKEHKGRQKGADTRVKTAPQTVWIQGKPAPEKRKIYGFFLSVFKIYAINLESDHSLFPIFPYMADSNSLTSSQGC
jgi:hypothetical protein